MGKQTVWLQSLGSQLSQWLTGRFTTGLHFCFLGSQNNLLHPPLNRAQGVKYKYTGYILTPQNGMVPLMWSAPPIIHWNTQLQWLEHKGFIMCHPHPDPPSLAALELSKMPDLQHQHLFPRDIPLQLLHKVTSINLKAILPVLWGALKLALIERKLEQNLR